MDFDKIRHDFFAAFDTTVAKLEEFAIDFIDGLEEAYDRVQNTFTE